ncbi:Choline-sulfatase [Paenibacillus konkukensis]|uniref:Choline-sulfatase n=2 Tax=Paenibacillus konkukensis TaxID=2020716 RepID=A0ABY4RYP9_9BACL|nr:sulfatase-like hydrolase/transferase [Paenibacillus konkukensis]UQZ86854.1 Choline-sulfatase [Paenibacillus konkukensis]
MNIVIIMSDEHSQEVMGCSGHPLVQTPVLDRLAAEGTRFTNCYTNCPVCTPARASFFTSKYVNELGTWDNATPYDGKVKGISAYLAEHGRELHSFGKLDFHPEGHYEGLIAPRPGFRRNIDTGAYFRDTCEPKPKVEERYRNIGIRSKGTNDQRIRDEAIEWLKQRKVQAAPWVMYVGFSHPHFPFFVKQEHWDTYDPLVQQIPEATKGPFDELNEPLQAMRRYFRCDAADEETIRRAHVGYFSLTTELDENIGDIVSALEELEMYDDTLIIYTSDHGEQLGNHGLWFKCCMYEESAHIPLIMKGPGVKKGATADTLVSLVDLFPTLCEALALPVPEGVQGRSLWRLATGRADVERSDFVFSEYHAHGMPVGMYMIRWDRWKYVHFNGYTPQLFDLENDPEEMFNQAEAVPMSDEAKRALEACERRLRSVCDPEETELRAKSFQARMKERLGIAEFTTGDPKSSGFVNPNYPVPFPEAKAH